MWRYKIASKAIIALVLGVVLLLFLLFGFIFVRNALRRSDSIEVVNQRVVQINQNRLATSIEHLEVAFSHISAEDMGGGISLGIVENEYHGRIYLESFQDVITIGVGNTTYQPLNLILKVFKNYEEVAFYVLGGEAPETEFLFTLDSAYNIYIPIMLSEQSGVHDRTNKITVGAFIAPEHFTMYDDDSDLLRFLYAMMLNFDIILDSYIELVLRYDGFFAPVGEQPFGGFAIHPNSEPPGDGSLRYLSDSLVVAGGEAIELSFFANGSILEDEFTDSYLIVAMLDWHQVRMNDKLYLLIDTENTCPSMGQYGQFVIMAPEKPGFYEFSAFMVPNPRRLNTVWSFAPLETAPRFTIEVVE